MPETTSSLGLKKPLPNEYYDIKIFNENMDILDKHVSEKIDKSDIGNIVPSLIDGKIPEFQLPDAEYENIVDEQASIIDIPKNAIDGSKVVEFKIKGFTAQNLIKNGDFSNGTTGWTTATGTFSVNNGVAEFIAKQQNDDLRSDNLKLEVGHIYYLTMKIKLTTATNLIGVGISYINGYAWKSLLNTQETTNWQILKSIVTVNSIVDGGNPVLYIKDFRSDSFDTIYCDEIMLIDLTEMYGSGNEPALEECDRIFNHYFEGLQGINSLRLKSVGKNLFNKLEKPVMVSDNTIVIPLDTGIKVKTTASAIHASADFIIKVKPNTTYTLSANINTISGASLIALRDGLYNTTIKAITTSGANTFTTPESGLLKILFYTTYNYTGTGEVDYTNIQLEEGSIATNYEHYCSSELYITLPDGMQLHSLLNGVQDTIEKINGEIYLIKRTGKYILQADDITEFGETNGGVNQYVAIRYNNLTGIEKKPDEIATRIMTDKTHPLNGKPITVANSAWCHYSNQANWCILLPQNTYSNISDAKTALAGTKVIYQLANPITYKNGENGFSVEGDTTVYKNGTVYVEPYIKKPYNYNNGITLSTPISQIDKITDTQGNTYTGTLSTDGKTITISSATNGDSYIVYAPILPKHSFTSQITLSIPANLNAAVNELNKTTKEHGVRLSEHNAILLGLALENVYQDAMLNAVQYGTLVAGDGINLSNPSATYNYVKKVGKVVQLGINVTVNFTGSAATQKTICTIPTGFRPSRNIYTLGKAVVNGNVTAIYVYIYVSGTVNVTLPASTVVEININTTWIMD